MKISYARIGAICGILCGLAYVFFTLLAMRVFPGGFDVAWGYMSTLGVTVTAAGIPSPINSLFFATACTLAAVFLIPFWLTYPRVFSEPKRARHTALIGSVIGVAASPFVALVGFTPGNLMIDIHRLVSFLFFVLYIVAVLVYSYAILLSKDVGNRYAIFGIVSVFLCFLHITGPLMGLPQIQKIAVYSMFLWPLFQGIKLVKIFRITDGLRIPSWLVKPLSFSRIRHIQSPRISFSLVRPW